MMGEGIVFDMIFGVCIVLVVLYIYDKTSGDILDIDDDD